MDTRGCRRPVDIERRTAIKTQTLIDQVDAAISAAAKGIPDTFDADEVLELSRAVAQLVEARSTLIFQRAQDAMAGAADA